MNILLILSRAAEFSAVFYGILICLLPVTNYLKIQLKKLLLCFVPICCVLFLAFGYLCVAYQLSPNFFFLPLMAVCAIAYFRAVNLPPQKLFYLFLCAIAALSFGGIAGEIANAVENPQNQNGYFIYGLIVHNGIDAILLLVVFCIRKKITWLLEHFHSKFVWQFIWTVPALIAFCNFSMIPLDYANVSVGKIFHIYLVIDTALFLFFILFQIMFYKIATASAEKYLSEKTVLMYQMQINQYEFLNAYIEQAKRMRHDFRHVMATAHTLLQNGQYDELLQYMNDYSLADSDNAARHDFCTNLSINALLSHYANIAAAHEIPIHFQIQIPDNAVFSDIDLSILFGNLLDNAIFACKTLPQAERYINLTADTETPGSFYIAMANSYDGKIKKRDGVFLSTKENGSGLGLSSIHAIAEKYHGIAEFDAREGEFISNVMLRG